MARDEIRDGCSLAVDNPRYAERHAGGVALEIAFDNRALAGTVRRARITAARTVAPGTGDRGGCGGAVGIIVVRSNGDMRFPPVWLGAGQAAALQGADMDCAAAGRWWWR